MTADKSTQDAVRVPGDAQPESARSGAWATAKKVAKKVRQRPATKKTAASARKTTRKSGRATRAADEPATTLSDSGSTRNGARESGRAAAAKSAVTPDVAGGTPPADAPRPPAPLHPGASADPGQEQVGGLGGMLALWGPLIIVAFLVLVFRGADDREGEGGTDAGVSVSASEAGVRQMNGTRGPAPDARAFGQAAGRPPRFEDDAERERSAYSRGGTMQTSIAGRPDFANRGPGTMMPTSVPRGAYPPPRGPYLSPWARRPPPGEPWAASEPHEWSWPAEPRAGDAYARTGGAPVQWVRCARPYYWCPAPGNPSW